MLTNIPTLVCQGNSEVRTVWHRTSELAKNFHMDYWFRLASIRVELGCLFESQSEGTCQVPQSPGVLRDPDMLVLESV